MAACDDASAGVDGGSAERHAACGRPSSGSRTWRSRVSEALRLEPAVRSERSRRHLVAKRQRLRRRRPLPRLRRSRLQLRVPAVHAGRPGGVRQEHSVVRPREGQSRCGRASRRAHRPQAGAAARARQRHLRYLQSDGHAARDSVSRSAGAHRAAGSHLSAFRVGLRPPHDLDGRPQAAVAGRRRHPAMVGVRGGPLGRQHARRLVDGLRRADVGGLLRLPAQRSDDARGALHAHQLRHARTEDDAHRSEVLPRAVGRRDQAHAPAPERLHQAVELGRSARGSLRAGERARIQPRDSRPGRHRQARGACVSRPARRP